jgi:hypothetical protein
MSFNLIDAAKGIFTNELVSKASSYLGESENSVVKAMSGILPSVIGGIADKSTSTEGANAIAGMAQEHHSSGILGSIGSFFGNEGGGLLNKGAGLLGSLFGENGDAHQPHQQFCRYQIHFSHFAYEYGGPGCNGLFGQACFG